MINKILPSFAIAVALSACTSQIYMDKNSLNNALSSREFTFIAKHANPTNYDVVKVLNSLPNSTSQRMLELDYGYGFKLQSKEMEVTLPYFGRMYTPNLDPQKAGFRFTTKDFEISEQKGKKDSQIMIIMPHDMPNVSRIIIEIYETGAAYVSVDSNDRQPISYDGYITKNEIRK